MLFLHKQAQRGQIVGLILKAVLGTLFAYASLGGPGLPDDTLWPEDGLIPYRKKVDLPRAMY